MIVTLVPDLGSSLESHSKAADPACALGEKPPAIPTRVRHWEAEAFFWMQTRINLPQLLHQAECGFAQLSQSFHANFFHPFLGRHSQSHSFRWTNMTRHWREKSQLKINTSSNTLFTFLVSFFIPKYPVGAGARWLTRMLLRFSHAYLVVTYGNLTLCGLGGVLVWATCFCCWQPGSCCAALSLLEPLVAPDERANGKIFCFYIQFPITSLSICFLSQ